MIKSYYETENGKLYHGDCLEIMPELEPVDLVITDPPYGIGIAKNGLVCNGGISPSINYGKQKWDLKQDRNIFTLIFSISKNQIIFGGNYYTDFLKPTNSWIFWDKIKYSNGSRPNNSDGELAWTSFTFPLKKIAYLWRGMIKESPETRYHPTQKPVGLFMLILDFYSEVDNLILDPFLGSGTTVIACEKLGKKWIGIEISEEYCEIAAKRIENERKQLKLF